MHGGANAQNPAMHGGRVLPLTWHGSEDNLLTWLIRGGVRDKKWRVATPPRIMAGCSLTKQLTLLSLRFLVTLSFI